MKKKDESVENSFKDAFFGKLSLLKNEHKVIDNIQPKNSAVFNHNNVHFPKKIKVNKSKMTEVKVE